MKNYIDYPDFKQVKIEQGILITGLEKDTHYNSSTYTIPTHEAIVKNECEIEATVKLWIEEDLKKYEYVIEHYSNIYPVISDGSFIKMKDHNLFADCGITHDFYKKNK